jgi:leucyl aminopeptidase
VCFEWPSNTAHVTDYPGQDGKRFFDITDHPDLGAVRARTAFKKKAVFPKKPTLQKEVKPLLADLSKKEMEDHLTTFTSFHTRYYKVQTPPLDN